MTSRLPPEAWLRGPVPGISAQLQPVAHALVQAIEDAERLTAGVSTTDAWTSPGGAATIGFHLRHAAGSLDRLLTYARGEALTDGQRAALATEKESTPDVHVAELVRTLRDTVEHAMAQLRSTATDTLDDVRLVGRAGHPSTVRGLLYHAGEHTVRHIGQVATTIKFLKGAAPSGE
jgi:hypothetical protein